MDIMKMVHKLIEKKKKFEKDQEKYYLESEK
jgi:hypothetical protein